MNDRPTRYSASDDAGGFKFADSAGVKFDVEGSMTLHAQQLGEHEGRIQGLNTALQSVQSSLNFWQAGALGMAGLILAGLAVVVTYQIKAADDIGDQGQRFSELERKVDALPDRISESMRSTSRDLVLITQAARQSPTQEGGKGK